MYVHYLIDGPVDVCVIDVRHLSANACEVPSGNWVTSCSCVGAGLSPQQQGHRALACHTARLCVSVSKELHNIACKLLC